MKLGMQAAQRAADMASDLLKSTRTLNKMNEGFLCSEDESLTVTMKVRFSKGEHKPVSVSGQMTFPVEKHKENLAHEIDELRISLFSQKPEKEPAKLPQGELDTRERDPI
jgi:hypothetical protein